MRLFANLLLTSLFLVSFSALAKAKKSKVLTPKVDKVDTFVLEQDMARTMEELGLAEFESGFGAHFIESALNFLKENSDVTLRLLDQRLRKWKTPIHLLAVDKKLMDSSVAEGTSLCLKSLPGQTVPPQFALIVIVATPEEKDLFKKQYSIGNDDENESNLEATGAVEPCQEV